jgi:hypothetical protein
MERIRGFVGGSRRWFSPVTTSTQIDDDLGQIVFLRQNSSIHLMVKSDKFVRPTKLGRATLYALRC